MEHHESAANLLYEAIHAFLAPALYTRSLHTSEGNPNIRNGE